jgi:hypothetical protein
VKDEVLWKAAGSLASIGAGMVAANLAAEVWRRGRHDDPPANPADPQTSWGEAIAWSLLVGVTMGLARLIARRGAAEAWRRAKGSLPPGLEEVDT